MDQFLMSKDLGAEHSAPVVVAAQSEDHFTCRSGFAQVSSQDASDLLQVLQAERAEFAAQNAELRRAQAELEQAHARYFALYDLAPVGYCTVNAQGEVGEANLTITQMFGVEREAFIAQPLRDFIHVGDIGQYDSLIAGLLAGQASEPCELRMVRCDRTWFWARLIATAEDRHPLASVRIVVSDISESKRIGDALRESEEFFRLSFEEHDAIKLHIDPHTGAIIRANNAAARFYGWSRDELQRMRIQDVTLEDSLAQVPALLAAQHYQGKSECVFQHRLRCGAVRHMEVFASNLVYRERNLLHCIVHDITHQVQAEQALKDSEAKYRALSEDMPLMVCRFTPELRLTYVNATYAASFGQAPERLLGTFFLDLIPETEHQAMRRMIASMSLQSPCITYEHSAQTPDGQMRWQRWTDRALFDSHGQIIAYQAIGEDITERKRADEEIHQKTFQLERANAEKDKLFAIIAHDLRSPLSSLLTTTDLLAEDIEMFSPGELQSLAKDLNHRTHCAYELLEDLLQWARMSQGGADFVPSPTCLSDLIGASLQPVRDLCREKDIVLTEDLQAGLTVLVDQPMINTVVRNILFNAIKFTHRGGQITVSSTQKGHLATIIVADTGIGIGEEKLATLFEVTKGKIQVGTEGEKGTGLGLVLCKEFVVKHGGSIWVDSQPGVGTRVFFTLPLQG